MRKVLGEDKAASNLGRGEQNKPALGEGGPSRGFLPDWFLNLQNEVMRQKREKYGPYPTISQSMFLYDSLKTQVGKLRVALDKKDGDAIARRAAHVANYAMLIAIDTRKVPTKESSLYPAEGTPNEKPTPEDSSNDESSELTAKRLRDAKTAGAGEKPA